MAQRSRDTDARNRLLDGAPVEERRVDVDGVATSLLEGGDGPPLVLLHSGSPTGGAVWTLGPVVEHLTRSHRVVVPDLPGVGESAAVARLDTAIFDSWFAGLLSQTCGDDRPTLVAHSLSASMAARFATRHSDLLRRLVLMGVPSLGRFKPPIGFMLAGMLSGLRPNEHNQERFVRWAFLDLDRTRKELGARFDAHSEYALSCSRDPAVKRTMRQLVKVGTEQIPDDDLRRITAPTALLWGRADRMIPLGIAEAASSRLGWPLYVVDDAGHMPANEQPQAFLDALARATSELET